MKITLDPGQDTLRFQESAAGRQMLRIFYLFRKVKLLIGRFSKNSDFVKPASRKSSGKWLHTERKSTTPVGFTVIKKDYCRSLDGISMQNGGFLCENQEDANFKLVTVVKFV